MNNDMYTALHTIIGVLPWIIILVVIPVGAVATIGWVITNVLGAL